jgi:hypothetical protein
MLSPLVLALAVAVCCRGQDNHPPLGPTNITITDITVHSARIAWNSASDADGDALIYRGYLRARINGVAQSWTDPVNTSATTLVWDGLLAGTTYDVKGVAFDGKATGTPLVKENAFATLSEHTENHPPSLPGEIGITDIAAHAVRVSWAASTDADGDPLTYQISMRPRGNGVVLDWTPATNTSSLTLVWGGLLSEKVYDVRVRASDGKSFSNWRLKENTFQTTPEHNAPGKPGEITVSEVTSTSARVNWKAATGPAGVQLAYAVQLRARIEGVAQSWVPCGDTTNLWLVVAGLTPGRVYDVQVRAIANTVAGAWSILENAFRTLRSGEANHAPTAPGPMRITEFTPFSVRLAWGPSTDGDGDPITYVACLRPRINGVAQAWLPARQTGDTALRWDGLSPKTVYDVRLAAWDGKTASPWYLIENAFQTPGVDHLANFAQPADASQPGAAAVLTVVWPDTNGTKVLEAVDSLQGSTWTQCQEAESDGAQTRAVAPITGAVRFFRVR